MVKLHLAGQANETFVDRFVVVSGCSGGGKSTLLVELGGRGNAVVESIGRTKGGEGTARGGNRRHGDPFSKIHKNADDPDA